MWLGETPLGPSSRPRIHRSLWHLHCLGNVRYCSPRCFHPNDLLSLADGTFPHDEVKMTGHKKLTFGWPKLCWFQLYCSKNIWSISLIIARHVTRYTHIILTIFSGSHSMSNTMKNKFGKCLEELFFQGCICEVKFCEKYIYLRWFTMKRYQCRYVKTFDWISWPNLNI